jgi:predicted nucleic acid-binding protein
MLSTLLDQGQAATHPFIIGEMACGNLKRREEILNLMQALPFVKEADHDEILRSIEVHDLMGSGLGLIDVHLIASALLSNVPLWTRDKSLEAAARTLGLSPNH